MRKLIFRVHAIQKMFERHISHDDVRHVLEQGEVIREYVDDQPFTSRLILGWRDQRPCMLLLQIMTRMKQLSSPPIGQTR